MDSVDLALLREWGLDSLCVCEQDRTVLRRKELERRNQEAPPSDLQFDGDYPLFSEPYKTCKGDELSSRVQNTLGSYDEMKDLLTDRSNQSQLIGIPKTGVLQATVDEAVGQFPSDSVAHPHLSMCSTSTCSPGGVAGEDSQRAAMSCHKPGCTPAAERRHKTSKNGHMLLASFSNDYKPVSQKQTTEFPNHYASSSAFSSSSMVTQLGSRRSPLPESADIPQQHSELNCNLEAGLHTQEDPGISTKHTNNGRCVKNFSGSLSSKLSIVQRKPTAYVRPMDGQDQAPDASPNLKSSTETNLNGTPYRGVPLCKTEPAGNRTKTEKVSAALTQEEETGPGDNSCVEEILREMTHSWPPPLSAIQTPGKGEQNKTPFPNKDIQHGATANNSERREDAASKDPALAAPRISMLEDDLKLSSDEEDLEQRAAAAQRPALGVLPDRALVQQQANRSASDEGSSGSSGSSDSESSSASDSESGSSSSDSAKPPHCSSPEPERPSSNKWQLDKWLNKVNPQKQTVLNQKDTNRPQTSQYCIHLKDRKQECGKGLEACHTAPSNTDIPVKEEQRPRTANKAPLYKVGKQKPQTCTAAAYSENTLQKTPLCKKQLRRTERTSTGDTLNCHQSQELGLSQDTLSNTICEQVKSRLPCSNRSLCKKELRPANFAFEKKHTRRLCKPNPKSKDFIVTECSSLSPTSELGVDSEVESSHLPKPAGISHTLKECDNSNKSRVYNSCTATGPANTRNTNDLAEELEEQLYTLVPFGRNELLSPTKNAEEVKTLWVQIDLALLSRIPYHLPFKTLAMNSNATEEGLSQLMNGADLPAGKCFLKCRRKRKCGTLEDHADQKRNQVETQCCSSRPPASSISAPAAHHGHTPASNLETPINKQVIVLQSPVSPLHAAPKHNHRTDGVNASMKPNGSNLRPSNKILLADSPVHSLSVEICNRSNHSNPENGLSSKQLPQREAWFPPGNGQKDCRRPKLTFNDRPRRADYFMQEAKRMKHKADAMLEKFGKALNYTEAALSFIECGNALEHGPMESKSPYTMYSETVELIRYAMRLKSHSGPNSTSQEKQLAALCYRCLALLYWRMFRLKRDHAVKYSKALIDYFKTSAKAAKASSPWGANGKSTGTPSPLSPSPSPVSSTGSQGSVSSTRASSPTAIISIPQRVHQMAANHVSITNSILHSYDYWEIADNLTKENTEFFSDLDSLMGPVTLHSSMEHLVQYTRQGLHWVRSSALFS
ncbi:AF4/FMR2 family member 3 [Ambystoma mexicanum]|uniref:AF4/FMR2 family member 3 n=1 Tax=Ambystoma mexicanum TaxID=8296 RepID=UPI0037E93AC7